MARASEFKDQVRNRLKKEVGTIYKVAPTRFALVKPSPYFVSMSSLGLQQIYRNLNAMEGVVAERAFLPDDPKAFAQSRIPLFTYESMIPVGNCDMIGFSVAYELEICGMLRCLELSGMPFKASDRGEGYPLVIIGGPLTFSNPLPTAPFADVVLMGEADELILEVVAVYQTAKSRGEFFDAIEHLRGVYLPHRHGERLVPVAKASTAILPAFSVIRTPETELRDMHLVEAERGCHRKCSFCVMRRSTNGGMRLASPEDIFATIPKEAKRVGLVGAAVSDHPKIVEIIRQIVDSGREVGLSSLRADRLTPAFVEQLRRGGLRTLTIASDGSSERLRRTLMKNIKEKHLFRAADLAAAAGIPILKIYMMVGVPGETPEDIEELIDFMHRISKGRRRVALGIAPFVAKRNTPLDRRPFAGIKEVERILKQLRKGLKGVAEIRSTSARWAWVEYELAQGGFEMADVAIEAYRGGESFAVWKRAIKAARKARSLSEIPGLFGLPQAAVLAN